MPFALAAVIAEASLALPPGPSSNGYTALSAGLLVGVIAAVIFLPWQRLPAWSSVLIPVVYVWSVCTLILATGSRHRAWDRHLDPPLLEHPLP